MSRSSLLAVALLLVSQLPVNAQVVPLSRPAAEAILEGLVGDWTIRDGSGRVVGSRTIATSQDALTFEWTEDFGEAQTQGFLGYDTVVERFYILGVTSSEDSRTMFLSGTWDSQRKSIRWEPLRTESNSQITNRSLIASVMFLAEPNNFRWAAFDERWSYSFSRQ